MLEKSVMDVFHLNFWNVCTNVFRTWSNDPFVCVLRAHCSGLSRVDVFLTWYSLIFIRVSCSWTFWDRYNNTQVCMQNSVCVSTVIWKYEMEGYKWSEEVGARCSFSCCKCLIKFFFFFSYNYVYFLHLHWANGTLTKGWQMIVFVCTCKNYVYSWKAKFMRTFILIFINS